MYKVTAGVVNSPLDVKAMLAVTPLYSVFEMNALKTLGSTELARFIACDKTIVASYGYGLEPRTCPGTLAS